MADISKDTQNQINATAGGTDRVIEFVSEEHGHKDWCSARLGGYIKANGKTYAQNVLRIHRALNNDERVGISIFNVVVFSRCGLSCQAVCRDLVQKLEAEFGKNVSCGTPFGSMCFSEWIESGERFGVHFESSSYNEKWNDILIKAWVERTNVKKKRRVQ